MCKITKEIVALVVAILAVIGFPIFLYYMLGLTKVEEIEWNRAVYLFSGVEAIVYAAVGYLFGKDVNRERAEKAEERADAAMESELEYQKKAIDAEKSGKCLVKFLMLEADEWDEEVSAKIYRIQDTEKVLELKKERFNKIVNHAKELFP